MILVTAGVVLEAVARPVRESRRVLGQTREGLEGGWEEGGEKGGRDEGWREEEEVRRGWREGVERGSIGGCGRSIEFSEREEWRRRRMLD